MVTVEDAGRQPPTFVFTPENKLLTISKRASNIEIREYLPDGSPYKRFGKNGQINVPLFTSVSAIRLLNDNSFLIAGDNKSHNFTVSGFLPNGQSNLKFGNKGAFTTRFGEPYSYVAAISPPANNKFIAAGFQNSNNPDNATSGNEARMVLTRFNDDGKSDAAFGNNGKVEIETPSNEIENFKTGSISALEIQKDGKIMLAGQIDLNFGIVRLLQNGKIDTSFGTGGFVKTGVGKEFYQSNIMQIKLQPDGKILAAGYANLVKDPSDSRFVIARFLPGGESDASFGKDGFIISDFKIGDVGILDMFVEPDRKLLIVGADKNQHLFLMRYIL